MIGSAGLAIVSTDLVGVYTGCLAEAVGGDCLTVGGDCLTVGFLTGVACFRIGYLTMGTSTLTLVTSAGVGTPLATYGAFLAD